MALESETQRAREFEEQASRGQTGLLREYLSFLRHERKWWLAPILLALFVAGAFVLLGGTAAAPFIYAVF
jgi:hypothetical protein